MVAISNIIVNTTILCPTFAITGSTNSNCLYSKQISYKASELCGR